ncbi:monocopper oxidase-like protein SKU5 [Carica papaya]|uniref:monocopper oxidase-like protein SKU5 n=1 Tax=Carica papaya TaxID=3649 RepID=UPI000B8C83A6|nr:monocopper oxidase-like protein SKU5 [Carica papaya]
MPYGVSCYGVPFFFVVGVLFLVTGCFAGDPYVFYDWTVSYVSASPLGVKQQVIGINGQFPGPILNITTNWNVVINVKNDLDEPLLLTWNGIQQRKNSWQDGVSGTNCPIPAGWNWTYQFQVKDQIGSFFYFPSLNFQRAAGGYGGIIVNNRDVIPLPFGLPDGDITIFISDWYTKSHKKLRKDVENGIDPGVPDGVVMNGFGPYRYDEALVADGITFQIINVEPVSKFPWRKTNFWWNISAGAARPNPQGSFKYGQITVTDFYLIVNRPAELIDGRWHTTLNGISYLTPSTPLKLAQQFKIPGVYKVDFPNKMMNRPPKVDTSLINGTFKGFMEIIFQNNATTVQSYHMDGYAFFVVGMDFGVWTENSRGTYNKWDGVARSTIQVFPGAWTAILVSLDNAGIWNLRADNLNSWYLGQEVYVNVVNPEIDQSEVLMPENAIYCGLLSPLQKDQAQRVHFSGSPSVSSPSGMVLIVLLIALLRVR